MQEENKGHGKKSGPIQRMFDWTFAILVLVIIIGIVFKYLLKPLYLG